jgi:integrase/recombinase XerC
MGRPARIWWRTDRAQWFATIRGRKVALGVDRKLAEREFHRRKAESTQSEIGTLSTWVLVERYLEWASTRVKPVTHKNYRAILQSWIDSYGSLRAAELRPFHVTRWIEGHGAWGRSTQSLNATIVKIWSAWCAREGYLDVDRLRVVKVAGIARRAPASPKDIDRALAAIEDPCFADFLTVLRETACRPGEIRALEAATIDFKASTAIVRGKRGQRLVGLSKRALAILRRHASAFPSGPVFRSHNGTAFQASEVSRRMERACKSAGLAHVTPYHLRHDYYRRASLAGVPDVIIARQLGHRTLAQLVSRYAHPDASQLAAAVEAASTSASPSTHRRQKRRAGSPTKRLPRKRGKSVARARR